MVMLSRTALKTHRRQVLQQQLVGQPLLAKVREQTMAPEAVANLENLSAVNAFLLWHLAHTPRAEDRAMLWAEGVTAEFEEKIQANQHVFAEDPARAALEPIPFSPVELIPLFNDDRWLGSHFLNTEVDWQIIPQHIRKDFIPQDKDTIEYLLGLLPFIVMKGQVAPYRQFTIDYEQLKDSYAIWNYFRAAFKSRRREIDVYSKGKFFPLSHLPSIGNLAVFSFPDTPGEKLAAFCFSDDAETYTNALYIKNSWPIGYASGLSSLRGTPGYANVNMHVFREFRGTKSSATFLHLFISAIARSHQIQEVRIWRGVAPRQEGFLPENQEHTNAFYERHGFFWFDEETLRLRLTEFIAEPRQTTDLK